MKYVDEFRNKKLAVKLSAEIKKICAKEQLNFMEVCGTHTQSFYRFGIDKLLPENINLIAGPGCPVCVSSQDYIDKAGGLPFVIIHKPEITENALTFSRKRYPISIEIECFTDSAAKLKILADAIRNALEGNRSTFRTTDTMFNFRIVSDTEDFDLRGNKRIHICRMIALFDFMGGG